MNLTPINKNLSRALLLTASLMTTIIQAGVNLAYGKQATQSSDFSSTLGRARNAVDGNTDGNWYNNSTTSTRSEQGAWWQVDLGSKKIINQIIIYNRTDCCADRLKSYRVLQENANFLFLDYKARHLSPELLLKINSFY
jgi:hypothetical protein